MNATTVAATTAGSTKKLTRLRRIIAERMMSSLHGSAQLTTVVEVDVTGVAALREAHKAAFQQRTGVKLSFLPFFAVAAVEALAEHPIVNAVLDMDGGTVTYPEGSHLSVAVDTDNGLFVPVIRDAGTLSLEGLAQAIDDLARRTREGRVTAEEMSGGTFTLTNTGSRGALFDTPILNQPQSAILGTGAVVRRPAAIRDATGEERIALRSIAYLALTYDHRIMDGADAARFLGTVKQRLEAADFAGEFA